MGGSAQSFEAAVVRPHNPAASGLAVAEGGGRFSASLTLKYMIQVAYDVAPYQISGGPDWLDKEVWDITAKASGYPGEIPFEKLRPMLRELIRERFQISLRKSKQELTYFALVVDKKGAKLKPSSAEQTDFHLEKGITLNWLRVSLPSFASWLQPWLQSDRVVRDETGLSGNYDIRLQWTGQPLTAAQDSTAPPNGPTIFTALREQLGLRLESRRGSIDTLIVEYAERPSDN